MYYLHIMLQNVHYQHWHILNFWSNFVKISCSKHKIWYDTSWMPLKNSQMTMPVHKGWLWYYIGFPDRCKLFGQYSIHNHDPFSLWFIRHVIDANLMVDHQTRISVRNAMPTSAYNFSRQQTANLKLKFQQCSSSFVFEQSIVRTFMMMFCSSFDALWY